MIPSMLDERKIAYIYESALRALAEIGVHCQSGETAKRLSDRVKVEYRGERMYFDRAQVDEFFQTHRARLAGGGSNDAFTLGGHWHGWYLCDPKTNRLRQASDEDCARMARLSEGLGSRSNPIPIGPGDVAPRLHTLACERIALKNTARLGGRLTATDPDEIALILDMYEAAGRSEYVLAVEPFISPLKFNHEVMDVYFRWKDDPRVRIEVFSGIPMAGATAPLVNPAALTLSLAEGIGQEYIFYHLSGGSAAAFDVRLEAFDMSCLNIAFGSPEWCLYRQTVLELMDGLGLRVQSGSFRTNSRTVDSQALVERTASFLWQASLGARHFSAMGQLCVDEVFSPVQAIIDGEILKYGRRLFGGTGIVWDEGRDPLDVIREGIDKNGFVAADSTLDHVMEMFSHDSMFSAMNANRALAENRRPIEEEANERAEAVISAHDFALDEAHEREIDALYEKAEARFGQ